MIRILCIQGIENSEVGTEMFSEEEFEAKFANSSFPIAARQHAEEILAATKVAKNGEVIFSHYGFIAYCIKD